MWRNLEFAALRRRMMVKGAITYIMKYLHADHNDISANSGCLDIFLLIKMKLVYMRTSLSINFDKYIFKPLWQSKPGGFCVIHGRSGLCQEVSTLKVFSDISLAVARGGHLDFSLLDHHALEVEVLLMIFFYSLLRACVLRRSGGGILLRTDCRSVDLIVTVS